MGEKKNKPEIRFKGFAEAWEERELGELFSITSASRVHKNEWTESGVPFFRSSDVVAAYKGAENNKAFISFELFEELSKKSGCVQKNDLLVTGGGSIGIPYLVKTNEPFYFKDADLLWLKNTNNINGYFIYTFFSTLAFRCYVNSITHIGTISHYTIEQAKSTPIKVPEKEEHDKIGTFLTNLDSFITLHQQKYNKLATIKKSMLEKMFPQNGAKVPEIRFKGFTGDWEVRKLAEIAERITRKNTDLESTLPLTISAQYGLVDQITFFNNRVASKNISGYYLIKKGEFAYNKSYSDGYPFGAVKRLEKHESGVLSTLYILFKLVDVNSDFLVSYYDTNNWHKEVALRAAEGARNHGLLNISADDFFDTALIIPKSKSEQSKIGTFFKHLDHLLNLEQRELEKLKNIKKACLEKMFV